MQRPQHDSDSVTQTRGCRCLSLEFIVASMLTTLLVQWCCGCLAVPALCNSQAFSLMPQVRAGLSLVHILGNPKVILIELLVIRCSGYLERL